jgi:hypothetical protein
VISARRSGLILALTCSVVVATCSLAAAQSAPAPVEVEIFPVLELPLTANKSALVKRKGSYLLRCSLTNGSEFQQLGLRYSLAIVDAAGATTMISSSEGFKIDPYQSRDITFKTPLRLRIKEGSRVVLMLQQVLSSEYVWEVIKAKDALSAYLEGDYSITPRVLRVSNQVDAPIRLQVFQ